VTDDLDDPMDLICREHGELREALRQALQVASALATTATNMEIIRKARLVFERTA
jgi:hypothetical protein